MYKNLKGSGIKAFFAFVVCLICLCFTIVNPVLIKTTPIYACSTSAKAEALPSLKDIIQSLFKKEESKPIQKNEKVYVYLGGYPLGFTIKCKGAVVVAIANKSADALKEGDIITKIEDIEVCSSEEISAIINSNSFAGKPVKITFKRGEFENEAYITPIFDTALMIYKLGLWIRDDAAGVGTLTYIRKDNLRFGALGHSVCDIDTGATLPVNGGSVYNCNIVGLKRGVKGNPGELKGLFLRNGTVLGSLDTNNKVGVYGTFSETGLKKIQTKIVEVADRSEVKSGKAKILCTINGTEPREYDVEIVKTYLQNSKDNKSMFIRVTDKELISQTGGIVQGMSGSPIIQNNKLVGAVTHVFVSDPTKGYGVYADWMIDN